eukprot:m.57251 g.57251  ORF g.57251 m.57251 type:complete len:204 (-) comp17065_c0_seq1:44-655(-)
MMLGGRRVGGLVQAVARRAAIQNAGRVAQGRTCTLTLPHRRFLGTTRKTAAQDEPPVLTPSEACEAKVQDMIQLASERVPFVFPEDAAKLYNEGECVFVDVREPPEWFGTGLIKEALPVPRGVLEFTVGDQLELDRRVVLYCSNGYRAALAGSTMLDLGFTNVLNGGSFEALVDAGVATEDAAKVSQSKNLKKKERKLRKSSA